MGIATAAKEIIVDGMHIAVGGGQAITLVQTEQACAPGARSRTR